MRFVDLVREAFVIVFVWHRHQVEGADAVVEAVVVAGDDVALVLVYSNTIDFVVIVFEIQADDDQALVAFVGIAADVVVVLV